MSAMKQKKTVDPLFAEYARTAPLGDLMFYLEHADKYGSEFDARGMAIVADMRALADVLSGPKPGTPASAKRRAWELLARFKAYYYGQDGPGTIRWRALQADTAAIDAAGEAYEAEFYTEVDANVEAVA